MLAAWSVHAKHKEGRGLPSVEETQGGPGGETARIRGAAPERRKMQRELHLSPEGSLAEDLSACL